MGRHDAAINSVAFHPSRNDRFLTASDDGDQLGFGESFGRTIRARFGESVERHLDDLYNGTERPWVLEHIATTEGPVFSPLSSEEARVS